MGLWNAIVLSASVDEDSEVIDLFTRLSRSSFRDMGEDWRYLKAWEYMFCSHFRLCHFDQFKTGLRSLVQEFVKVADDPDEILERPNRILALYRELRTHSSGLADLLEEHSLYSYQVAGSACRN